MVGSRGWVGWESRGGKGPGGGLVGVVGVQRVGRSGSRGGGSLGGRWVWVVSLGVDGYGVVGVQGWVSRWV